MERQCSGCGCDIAGCMGFVKAGDVLEGKNPRELCARCALVWEWTAEDELVRQSPLARVE